MATRLCRFGLADLASGCGGGNVRTGGEAGAVAWPTMGEIWTGVLTEVSAAFIALLNGDSTGSGDFETEGEADDGE